MQGRAQPQDGEPVHHRPGGEVHQHHQPQVRHPGEDSGGEDLLRGSRSRVPDSDRT